MPILTPHLPLFIPLFISIFLLSTPTLAQTTSNSTTASLPQCALECLNPASLLAGCAAGDYACSCQHFAEISLEARPCILNACNTTKELPRVCEGIRDLCRVYKVPVPEGCGVNVTLDGGGGS
ncbi:uncharacterized protein SEPMUDRAFT_106234 [Sphaerulina musiva SO2202]|uniref:CFEM domain-containing protein n=1 Tax=Sphaerulina musiva (strain SO2202) TaxID=692275 RepID=M3B898_SPHMS|nr:uncharacterized protein SEPMUDRAFT_106234 [Sphaerulina musiva SO2202]EMF16067.1 hypothetical protein SEPMUDRAFT_106234 [Sphaerulina musiva SO2202]